MSTSIDVYRKVHFAVMAIEASAKKQNVPGQEMHRRLRAQGLIIACSATTSCCIRKVSDGLLTTR